MITALFTTGEGYLHAEVNNLGKKIAEIHNVPDGANQRFGLFGFDGGDEVEEQNFSAHNEGLQILEKMLK